MSFLVDTDICSAHLRGAPSVTNRFLQYTGRLYVSGSGSPPKYHQGMESLLSDVAVLDVTSEIAWKFGEIRAKLLDQGRPIATTDLMIAATAIVQGFRVVTHNTQHFSKIPGLSIEDWLVP